ncbi:MAG: DUF202 domain-containing protein [Egibacteraceae bacterium]
MDAPSRLDDRGLQRERTALAWTRTGLALLAAGAVYLRSAHSGLDSLWNLPGWTAIILGITVPLLAGRRQTSPAATDVRAQVVGAVATALCVASLLRAFV